MGRFEAMVVGWLALLCRLFDVRPPGHEQPLAVRSRLPREVDWVARRLAPSFHHQS